MGTGQGLHLQTKLLEDRATDQGIFQLSEFNMIAGCSTEHRDLIQ